MNVKTFVVDHLICPECGAEAKSKTIGLKCTKCDWQYDSCDANQFISNGSCVYLTTDSRVIVSKHYLNKGEFVVCRMKLIN